jgi:chromosome segregation ATPase
MDKEALHRQLEDMEKTSEQLRAEKRRLNAEIDKLEAELATAKTGPSRKSASAATRPHAIDPGVYAKLQEAAEEKFKGAMQEWERERSKLLAQISRLEGAVADAIARASNPMRMVQSVKDQFEVDLNRVAKEKTEVEQALLRAKTQWEQEKLKMTGEMVKLRRAAEIMGRPVPKEHVPEFNPKVRDLENQLKDSLAQWNTERERLVIYIQKLEQSSRLWDTERRQLNDHAGQLQQAYMEAQAKIHAYETAVRETNPPQAQLGQLNDEKQAVQRQFQEARKAWDAERNELQSQTERLRQQLQRMSETRERVSNEIVDQLRQQYEQRLQEAIQQKTQLAHELQSASKLLEAERARLSAAHTSSGGGLDSDAISAEVSRVEGMLSEIIAVIDNPDTELATVIRKNVEKAELDAYLRGILFTLGKK